MLRRNINVESGLVNGALGTVKRIRVIRGEVQSIVVKFDDIEREQEIERVSVSFYLARDIPVRREQFPLILAFAMTIHKSQGVTLSTAMIDAGRTVFTEGMTYVAISRVKTLNGLYLLNFDASRAVASKKCITEVNRLRSIYRPELSMIDVIQKIHECEPDRVWYSYVPVSTVDKFDEHLREQAGFKRKRRSRRKLIRSGVARFSAEKAGDKRKGALKVNRSSLSSKRKRLSFCVPVAPAGAAFDTKWESDDFRVSCSSVFQSLNGQFWWAKFRNNPGENACYSNSALHCLFSTVNFSLSCESMAGWRVRAELSELYRSYEDRKRIDGNVLNTVAFRRAVGGEFDSNEQQDVTQFISTVCELADVMEIFSFRLGRYRMCNVCEWRSDQELEQQLVWSLPMVDSGRFSDMMQRSDILVFDVEVVRGRKEWSRLNG